MVSRKAVDSLGLIMSGGLNRDDQVILHALRRLFQAAYPSYCALAFILSHPDSMLSLGLQHLAYPFSFILLYFSYDRLSCMCYSYPDRF
jgi:hypothetical protein